MENINFCLWSFIFKDEEVIRNYHKYGGKKHLFPPFRSHSPCLQPTFSLQFFFVNITPSFTGISWIRSKAFHSYRYPHTLLLTSKVCPQLIIHILQNSYRSTFCVVLGFFTVSLTCLVFLLYCPLNYTWFHLISPMIFPSPHQIHRKAQRLLWQVQNRLSMFGETEPKRQWEILFWGRRWKHS